MEIAVSQRHASQSGGGKNVQKLRKMGQKDVKENVY